MRNFWKLKEDGWIQEETALEMHYHYLYICGTCPRQLETYPAHTDKACTFTIHWKAHVCIHVYSPAPTFYVGYLKYFKEITQPCSKIIGPYPMHGIVITDNLSWLDWLILYTLWHTIWNLEHDLRHWLVDLIYHNLWIKVNFKWIERTQGKWNLGKLVFQINEGSPSGKLNKTTKYFYRTKGFQPVHSSGGPSQNEEMARFLS